MSAQPNIEDELFDITSVLKRVELFSGISDNTEALRSLSGIMEVRNCSIGETLLIEGEMGDEFFVLVAGQVSVFKRTPEGDAYKVAILKGDSFASIGEGGLIDVEPRTATVVCEQKSFFLVLSQEKFETFSLAHPEWAVPVYRKIARMLRMRLHKMNNDLMLLHNALTEEIRGR